MHKPIRKTMHNIYGQKRHVATNCEGSEYLPNHFIFYRVTIIQTYIQKYEVYANHTLIQHPYPVVDAKDHPKEYLSRVYYFPAPLPLGLLVFAPLA